MLNPNAPEPAPRSTTSGSGIDEIREITPSIMDSLSGRGIKTPGPTASVR